MAVGYKILHRGDTAANWAINDPVISARELVIETDTQSLKIGDGVKKYSELQAVAGRKFLSK